MTIYRPPNAQLKSFSSLLKHVQSYLDQQMQNKHYDINILGDFNFPNIDWTDATCHSTLGRDQQLSGQALLNFMDHNVM